MLPHSRQEIETARIWSSTNCPKDVFRIARDTGFSELAVTSDVAARGAALPPHHKDPFGRLLIAQAVIPPARLLTEDAALARYSDLVRVEPV